MKTDALNTFVMAVAAGVAVYFITKIDKAGKIAGQALDSAQNALASGLYTLFGPEERFGDSVYHLVTFPDGIRHSIPSLSVDTQGRFQYQNTWYRMLRGKDGLRYAAPL